MTTGNSTFLAFVVTAIIVVAGAANAADVASVAEKIEADFREGKISLDEKVLWQLASVKEPNAVPAEYRTFSTSVSLPGKSATSIFIEARKSLASLSPATQAAVAEYLARPSGAYLYDSPGGQFKLHYNVTGPNAVPTADDNINGVPDYIEKVADYCDSSWRTIVQYLGYMQPPSDGVVGGDSRYDIYFEEMQYYGYTSSESSGPNPWNDAVSWISLHRNFYNFPPNYDPEGNQWGAAKVTVAHEYFHAVQFAYDVYEALWWMEASSTWMEDIVFDVVNDNYNYLGSFFTSPQTALTDDSYHAYSSFIWNKFLEERLDTVIVRKIWGGCIYGTVYNATNDSLQSNYGYTFDSALAEFTSWNYVTAYRDDGLHYEEGIYYDAMALAENRSSYPVAFHNCPVQPQGYGSAYILLQPGAATGNLIVRFDGADAREWALYLIKSPSQNSHIIERLPVVSPTWILEDTVVNFESYASVALIAVNLTQYSAPAAFAYSAVVQDDYAVAAAFLGDTIGYSGYNHSLTMQVSNDGILADIIRLQISDSLGWITYPVDTLLALNSGADSIFPFHLPVPQGTLLSTRNVIIAEIQSQSNPLKTAIVRVPFVLTVQHGDADFNGAINILDVLYIISYLYKGGPEPEPVLVAGDFGCNGAVSILDVSSIIGYLYKGGSPSPCNPF